MKQNRYKKSEPHCQIPSLSNTLFETELHTWPPLWYSGQSSWLQIQRSGFDFRRYQIFSEVVGLERGPLSLVSAIVVLLERKSSCSGIENRDYGLRGSAALTTRHPYIIKSWH
jgi:hypothetical protein